MGPTPINDVVSLARLRPSSQECHANVANVALFLPPRLLPIFPLPSSIFSIATQQPPSHLQASTEELVALLCSCFVAAENGCLAAEFPIRCRSRSGSRRRETRGAILYRHPNSIFCSVFFWLPSHFGHSQQNLLLRFLVDTAAGVCGICPRTPEHVSQISELYNSVIRRKPQIFTCPVVRGDGQTVTCSLGIVVDSKLFANLAPHPSGFLSKMSWRRSLI